MKLRTILITLILFIATTANATVTIQFQLAKQKPVEAGQQFKGKQHTISVQIETFAPDANMVTDEPFSTDIATAPYSDVSDTVANQIAKTKALLFKKLSEILMRRNREYVLWQHAKHDQLIIDLTTDLNEVE